jgi:hypothetical protein
MAAAAGKWRAQSSPEVYQMTLSNLRRTRVIAGGSAIVMAAAMLAVPAGTLARGGGGIVHAGTCTAASTSKIKIHPDDGRIQVEFEVDQNRVGKTWNVRLVHNGNVFFTGKRVTQAPSGSFEVRKFTGNRAGTDTITGRATNPASGEVCTATASI